MTVSHVIELAQRSVEDGPEVEFSRPALTAAKIWSRFKSTANRWSAAARMGCQRRQRTGSMASSGYSG